MRPPGDALIVIDEFDRGVLIDAQIRICSTEQMQAARFHAALVNLEAALRETEAALEELRAQADPLAAHIFVSRRRYRNIQDTKSGKRFQTAARLSWQTACKLGFPGTLPEWERLMGAAVSRR